MDSDRELGLSSVTVADEILITKLIVQDQRRTQLYAVLDSLIKECEQAEANGLRIWNWELAVSERKKEKHDDR
jgi:hypothetical protein